MAPALFLMGVGPMTKWRQAGVVDVARKLRWAFGVSAVSAVVAPFALGHWTPMIGFALLLAAWVASTAVLNLVTRVREHPAGVASALAQQPGSYYGMLLAHFGVSVFIVGVTVVSAFSSETDVRMEPGQTGTAGAHTFRLDAVRELRGPNYVSAQATITLMRDGQTVATLQPERRVYNVSRSPMTEVAIDRGFTRDLYVALGEPITNTAWSVRVHHKPFVNWIWIGCLLMAMGGLLAVLDRRYRAKRSVAAEAAPPTSGANPSARPTNPVLVGKEQLR